MEPDVDLELILLEEEGASLPCFWEAPHCDRDATWEVLWSCGHLNHYCTEHYEIIRRRSVSCNFDDRSVRIVTAERIR